MQDCVLHECEAILAECALHGIIVEDVLRGAREFAVEVEGRDLMVGRGKHTLVDVLESLEAIEVGAGMGDDDVIANAAGTGHAGGWFSQKTGIERELSLREMGQAGVRGCAAGPLGEKGSGEKIGCILRGVGVGVGSRDHVGLQRPVGCSVVSVWGGRRRQGAEFGENILLRRGKEETAEFV